MQNINASPAKGPYVWPHMKNLSEVQNQRNMSGGVQWDKRLVRELAWVLLIKSVALFLIWSAFFSNPIDESLDAGTVHDALFSHAPG